MYYLCLFGFCLANCRAILKAKPDTHFAHGLALSVLTSYGGSTLCAIMCGNPVVFVVNESLVTLVSIAWCVSHNSLTRKPVDALLSSTPGAYYLSVAYEVMRCHVLLGCSKMAATTLAAYRTPFYPVPVVGPLIGAMLGGCGGGFMPLDKGLTPVEKGINWRIGSAVIASVWMLVRAAPPPPHRSHGRNSHLDPPPPSRAGCDAGPDGQGVRHLRPPRAREPRLGSLRPRRLLRPRAARRPRRPHRRQSPRDQEGRREEGEEELRSQTQAQSTKSRVTRDGPAARAAVDRSRGATSTMTDRER